jgi:transglutaminase-like putative cysteine protease
MILPLTRAILYLITLLIPLFEPAVLVSYDPSGIWLYAVLIPLSALLGLWKNKNKLTLLGILILLSLLIFAGLNREGLLFAALSLYAFTSTFLAHRRGLTSVLYIEPFVLGLIHYRLLLFTLSSPEMADKQQPFGAGLFFVLSIAFFLYSFLIYYKNTDQPAPALKNILILSGGALAILLFSFIISAEGALHKMVPENLNDPLVNDFQMMDLSSNSPLNEGNLQGNSDSNRTGRQPGDGNQPGDGEKPGDTQGRLLGVPGQAWDQAQQPGEGEGEGEAPRQYAVMVVESPRDSTYLAGDYFELHDYQLGFMKDNSNYLNNLDSQRYLETWKNTEEIPLMLDREPVKVSVMSVESGRVVPYYPYTMEPEVNNITYYPFVYTWNALSFIFNDRWNRMQYLSGNYEEIPEEVQKSLELDLPQEDLDRLDSLIAQADIEGARPLETMIRLLNLYSTYQYNVGYTEDWSSAFTMEFLMNKKEGDCTEFSNGAALLARRAGIPTRVVTGFLASKGLQNDNHRQGLQMLQQQIPSLSDKDLDNLYLVTTAHRHAWIQCWFPRYGWVDMETTDNALPPIGMGNANNRDVVIPIITETIQGERRFEIPWRALLRFVIFLALGLTVSLYLLKIAYIIILNRASGKEGEKALKASYRRFLMKWTDRGHKPRASWQTPGEYSKEHPALKELTSAFMATLYHTTASPEERQEALLEYNNALKSVLKKDRSILKSLREIISLKGLFYGLRSE